MVGDIEDSIFKRGINVKEDVPFQLALLSMKNGEGSKEEIEKVMEDQIRSGSVNKFNRLLDNYSGNHISI